MKILIINGSHRDGNTDLALKKVVKVLSPKVDEVRELKLRDIEMKLPDGCEACADGEICPNIKDQFSKEIEPTLHNYDIYIIATPVWDDNVTPLIKIFWDRIVTWCHKDRMYLRGKKLAVITHGQADENSWKFVVDWVKSVCTWEECDFVGSLTFKSGGKIGDINLDDEKVDTFINNLL